MPEYKKDSVYQLVKTDTIAIMNLTNEDVRAYVKILKQAGFTYMPIKNSIHGYTTEKEDLNMNLWVGKRDNMKIQLMLMIDLKRGGSNLEIKKIDL